jgi:hypothetical protein
MKPVHHFLHGSSPWVAENIGPIGLVKWSPQGDLLAVISDQSIIRVYETPALGAVP